MSIIPDNAAATDFLQRFRPNGPWTLTAIGPDPGAIETHAFAEAEAMGAWIAERNGQRNLYFMVNPATRLLQKKARREDVAALGWLHVDIDPRAGEDLEEERTRALTLLQQPPGDVPPPTVIIFSGGGYQGFWKLADPFEINGDIEAAERAKLWNLQLETVFGADHCHNVDRILRLPGTINIPDRKKRKKGRTETLATLVEFHTDRVYPLGNFTPAPALQSPGDTGFTPATDSVNVPGNVQRLDEVTELGEWGVSTRVQALVLQGHLRDLEGPKLQDDSRSEWLFDAVCQLVRAGVPDETIYAVITDPEFAISESVLDKGSRVESYATRQIARARERIVTTPARQTEDDFCEGTFAGDEEEAEEWRPPAIVSPFPIDRSGLPMRPWIVPGVLLRGHLTLIAGRGGAGKSTFAVHQACSVASGRAWAGFDPREPGRVLILQAEDDEDEQARRVLAACEALGLDDGQLKDRLLFVRRTRDTYLVITEEAGGKPKCTQLYYHLADVCREHNVDLLIVDPLVEVHGGLDENSNVDMKEVAVALRDLARRCNMAVVAVHHNRKSANAGDQDGARDASALVNVARIMLTLTPMSEEDAAKLLRGREKERPRFTRITGAKNNYDLRQPGLWIEMESTWLRNAGSEFGDSAPAMNLWEPEPEAVDRGLLLDLIERGPNGDGERRFSRSRTGPRATRGDALLEDEFHVPRGQGHVRLHALIEQGVLLVQSYKDKERRQPRVGLFTARELALQGAHPESAPACGIADQDEIPF